MPNIQRAFCLFLVISLSWGCGRSRKSQAAGTSQDPTPVVPEVIVKPPTKVDNVKSSTVDESPNPTIMRLLFDKQAKDKLADNRYLSEYLLVVRASKESCIRLAIKPGPDTDELEDASAIVSPSTFCDITKQAPATSGSSGASGEEDSSGTSGTSGSTSGASGDADGIETTSSGAGLRSDLALGDSSTSNQLCDQRVFRFELKGEKDVLGGNVGLDSIAVKTAYLVAQSKHINVWLDAEVDNPCLSGSPEDLDAIKYTLGSEVGHYLGAKDKLSLAALKNVASESEKIYTRLVSSFGPVSDVDHNSRIELVISPEVNRNQFYKRFTFEKDAFLPRPMNKKEDLSAFDGDSNPSSNEAEVVYTWAPDPGGLYQYSQYPSTNSLTSNFYRGYVAYQIMSLIMFNQDLTTRKGLAEEEGWLVQSLSMLASAYVAGNDYSFPFSAMYLSTRPQYLPLAKEIETSKVPSSFSQEVELGQIGYRTLFGWFLHTKLCGTTVAPCKDLTKLIQSKTIGTANVAAAFKSTIAQVLDQFGISLGIEMSPNPTAVREAIKKNGSKIATPLALPKLTEIYKGAPLQSLEIDKNANVVVGTKDDRTVAGPLPSTASMLYQLVLPDYPLDLNLAENSVTYILVTGMVEESSELKTHLGSNAAITIIPLGLRDVKKRKLHVEKLSQNAHMDLRPINLSKATVPLTTAYRRPEYESDFTVTMARELWALGSIDNYTINEAGEGTSAKATVADSDSFHLVIDPCLGQSDEAACRSGAAKKRVLVQVMPRDFKNELLPNFLVTPTTLATFRGQRFLARISTIDATNVDKDNFVGVGCFSEAIIQSDPDHPDFTNFGNCANGGLTKAQYQTEVCDNFPEACISGMPSQSVSFTAYTDAYQKSLDSDFVGISFDNFLHAGVLGFPFYNNYTITYPTLKDRSGTSRPFLTEEIARQFFTFSYTPSTSEHVFQFYPIFAGNNAQARPNLDPGLMLMDPGTIASLSGVKELIASGDTPTDTQITTCQQTGLDLTYCMQPVTYRNEIETFVLNNFSDRKLVCPIVTPASLRNSSDLDSLCNGTKLTRTGSVFGAPSQHTAAWISPDRFIVVSASPVEQFRSYYTPTYPLFNSSGKSFCLGETKEDPDGTAGIDTTPCLLDKAISSVTDLRTQLNVPSGQFTTNCDNATFGEDFAVCADVYGVSLGLYPTNHYWPTFAKKATTIERKRKFQPFSIATQQGEYIGREKTLHYLSFEVGVAQATNIHLMLSGLNMSTGKYFMRVRIVDYASFH